MVILPLFFFFQAIGISACERFDERGFAVVDVTRGADDDVSHKFNLDFMNELYQSFFL
jgi:hypothetical protein